MLAPHERIHREQDIQHIFAKGKRIDTPYFRLWRLDKKDRGFRAAVICSRKVDKRATKRNLLKRRLREILRRDIRTHLPATDIVLECKSPMKEAPFALVKKELFHVLRL